MFTLQLLTTSPHSPQANDRARELERVYQMRRGHVPQISISDDNHHVTEAIGDLYGGDSDTEPSRRNSRPLSFIPSPNGDSIQSFGAFEPFDPFPAAPPARSPLRPQMAASSPPDPPAGSSSHGEGTPSSIAVPANKRTSFSHHGSPHSHGPLSPPLSRTNSDTASQQFPLNDLDYESSPAGLAQELSNLQAIRRMSMGVNNADPDLPSFKSNGPPSPPALSDDDDPAKLFWVPARLHPELAPMEFKTFIEDKVNTIRRRSGDSDSLSPDGALGRQSSGGGLRRKKSMLSRQIDSGSGYKDGAERLERQRSIHQPNGGLSDLQELEHIHEDSTELVRQMSLSGKGTSGDGEVGAEGDLSIAPSKFGGLGTLKRSTRTTYRRGSLRKGGPPLSRRLMTGRQGDTDTEESPSTSPTRTSMPEVPPLPLSRVQSEPVNGQFEGPSNFSRPRRRSPPDSHRPGSAEGTRPASLLKPRRPKNQTEGNSSFCLLNAIPHASLLLRNNSPMDLATSSNHPLTSSTSNGSHPIAGKIAMHKQHKTLRSKPHNHNLSIIPNLPEEKKSDKKTKDKKDGSEGSRKTSWGWLTGGDKDKEKDKKEKEKDKDNKEERDKELAKKVKNKLSKSQDKSHDDTRLDVLQTSIQGSGRGRESLVLDREGVKLEEERKKESNRKSSSDGKKEKEPGLLSSIFGGGKKKGDKETSQKKASLRGLSPEPPPKPKIPDVDYNWTRFSILEERAIYRMAHIKLANPRRELYSQVLLSNFMYSYLAKVQQMHPQIQIGNSKQARQAQQQQAAQQKKEQEQQQPQALPQQQQDQPQQRQSRAQQSQQQPDEFAQYQRYQQCLQQQDQSDKNDWPSSQQQQNNAGSRQPQENGHHVQRNQYGNPYDQNPRDSHHSQHNANGGGGNGYSVANTQNYLGQGSKHGYTYSDSDQSSRADDDMW
ncbi:hypothetical protein SNOG_13054 [Parastagonospora nodorum SN15]|uniref:Protein Zds1 C-terminal domain-containing protein n=1 Tax=Phaeosphaeria nodorum (strain SN15 / ATCC MYA-4574 / FGSC 10173) TaxID=321614 RepID=Q0U5B0_PHANO|nr:hypothetical protein SNOG_13054 [Parastagonospora nodorum SN15]EAT79381.2 hypothetical protein SNOG_13054 [Parastagonospora nodorum SN15]